MNRTLAFIAKYYDGTVPKGKFTDKISDTSSLTIPEELKELYVSVGKQIETGEFRDALHSVFNYVRLANKYFDTEQPWITRTADPEKCENTIFNCVGIISNLAILLSPFLPFSSKKVCGWLSLEKKWELQTVPAGYKLPEISILFERIDKKVIKEENEKLKSILNLE